jgi:hypothetical protein
MGFQVTVGSILLVAHADKMISDENEQDDI